MLTLAFEWIRKMALSTPNKNDFKRGSRFVVQKMQGHDMDLIRRLMTLGLVVGTEIEVLNISPFGDPIQVKSGGYNLSLRSTELEALGLKAISS